MLHDICVGKTGTLTEGNLNVAKYQLCNNIFAIENDHLSHPNYFVKNVELSIEAKELIRECIISNTDVRLEINDEKLTYDARGQPIEVAMINFLIDNEENIHETFVNRNLYSPKIVQLPFN